MIPRLSTRRLRDALQRQDAVALLGPRQVGKTTLARQLSSEEDAVYLDLQSPEDLQKIQEPRLFLGPLADRLVVLDEIHRAPDLFSSLRGLIDEGRRHARRKGRFLILGSASLDLMKQSSESLAGRIAYVDLGLLHVLEIPTEWELQRRLWSRGGFPDSYLARSEGDSFRWRRDFIRTYLERDIPMFGGRIPSETMERLWTMLAHAQGGLLNASSLARNVSISVNSTQRYIDLLVDLLLVRRLQPFHANVRKRLVKTPKVYIRDSGLVHALLGIRTHEDLAGHPILGSSWEGFAMENLIAAAPEDTSATFYRTSGGAEIDLVLEFPGRERWAVEIKSGLVPKLGRGFHSARDDLSPSRAFVVYGGQDRFMLPGDVEAIGLAELSSLLHAMW